ncbi:MAG: ABC transporter substrate-binding protein [Chloroflexi bacterium]|nr:ABC transporter substrate-binding protein [Chloroflexota bacterium]
MALSWQPDADGLGWTFNLRSDVKWHDGQPFTADDVKYTFDRILDPATNTRLRGDFSVISDVQVIDPATVHFSLKQPFAPLPVFMSYTAGIVPKHILEGQDINTASDFNNKQPIGTGAFRIQEYVSGSHVTLAANPSYFRGRPKLDTLTYKIVPDLNSITAQLNTGELQFSVIQPSVFDEVSHISGFDVYPANLMNWMYVGPNLTNPIFQDKRVRQAMAYGIDRVSISNAISQGMYTVSGGPIPPFLKPWHNDSIQPFPYDPDKAAALFAEAGWTRGADGNLAKDGQPLSFKFAWGKGPYVDDVAVLVLESLKKMGMDATADAQEWNAYIKRFEDRDYEVLLDGWVAPYDPDVYSYFHSKAAKGGKNITLYNNPEVDSLLEQGRAETDTTRRQDIYNRLQVILADDQPTVFLWHPPELQARSQQITGFPPIALALGDLYDYADEFARVA